MLHISTDLGRSLITPKEAIAAVSEGFRLYGHEPEALSRPSAALTVVRSDPPRSFLLKGVALRELGLIGHSFGIQFGELYFAVCDDHTGELLGLLDQLWLNRLRTGATAAATAQLAGPVRPRIAAVVGAGAIGEQVVRCLDAAFALDAIRVASRTEAGARAFADRLGPELRAPLAATPTARDAIADADIVVTITFATEPLVHPGMLKRGAVLLAMGGAPEVHFDVLAEADRLIVDDLGYALLRGSLAAWVRGGRISEAGLRSRIDADIGEVAAGLKPARTGEGDTVLAVIQGMAVGDLAIAHRVLEAARRDGLGTELPLTRQAEPPSPEALRARTTGIVAGLAANAAGR